MGVCVHAGVCVCMCHMYTLDEARSGIELDNHQVQCMLCVLLMYTRTHTHTHTHNPGGGYYNHGLFFSTLSPAQSTGQPSQRLQAAIRKDFGSLQDLLVRVCVCVCVCVYSCVSAYNSWWKWNLTKSCAKPHNYKGDLIRKRAEEVGAAM